MPGRKELIRYLITGCIANYGVNSALGTERSFFTNGLVDPFLDLGWEEDFETEKASTLR